MLSAQVLVAVEDAASEYGICLLAVVTGHHTSSVLHLAADSAATTESMAGWEVVLARG